MKLSVNSGISLVLSGVVVVIVLGTGSARARLTFGTPVPVPNVNAAHDLYPSISSDGLEMYFHSTRPGGLSWVDLWVSTRATVSDPWGDPCNLGSTVNSSSHDTNPSISADGLSLYFCSKRPGGHGGLDLWVTTRDSKEDEWGQPENLGWPVNSSADEVWPSISADGLQLYFGELDVFRPGGQGLSDIWVATRPTKDDPWEEPENLGPPVNSSSYDDSPFITADGLALFFASARPGGQGNSDLWVTTRATTHDPWATPVNLGPGLNSSDSEDGTSISPDGRTLYFSSNRSGGYDIWQVPILPMVDFNGDRIANLKDFSKLAQCWQQNERSVDMGPMPWGNDIIDVQDLTVLAEYWLTELGLVAHWELDETQGFIAYDCAGDHDAFVTTEDPLWRPNDGKTYGALELDGTDDYVSTPFVLNPAKTSFSVFLWVKGNVPGQVFLSQKQSTQWFWTAPPVGWLMTSLGQGGALVSQTVVTDGQWHRIGLTWDGTNRTLYIDDVEAAKDTQTGLQSANTGLNIGAGKDLETETFFSSLIDDVRIYNRAIVP